MKYDTATPYLAAYVLLYNGPKVAFVRRQNTTWMNGYYGLPSGKVEVNESVTEAAIREALEGTGVIIKPGNLRHILTMHRCEEITWIDVYFEAANWQGEPYNAEPHMHSELAWLDVNNLPDTVIPSVRAALEAIVRGGTYSEWGW